jgi:hypothetical protein
MKLALPGAIRRAHHHAHHKSGLGASCRAMDRTNRRTGGVHPVGPDRDDKRRLVMKVVLTCAAVLAFTMTLALSPASARHPKEWVQSVVGQEVFNLEGNRVGRLERYIDVRGTPGVIITNDSARGRTIIAPAESLGRRDAGGLLLQLSDRSVARLPTYQPGRLPFW